MSARLRLLAYTDSAQVGGAELALGYLIGALPASIDVGVLATSAEVGAAIAAHRDGAVRAAVPAPEGPFDAPALRAHVRAVRAFAPDVLHVNQAWPWACGAGLAAGLLVPGVAVAVVDHLPIDSPVPRLRRLSRRLLLRRAAAHVAVGVRAARELEAVVGLPAGSVGAIPNGVPPYGCAAAPGGHAGTVVGSLGRLTAQKGYDALVRALVDLPDASLVLVGDGPERPSLERLAAELGVAERLTITGWTDDPRSHLPSFDVFALPSRWEGMPLVILEAMHAGLPVVATDVGSIAEAVTDGVTGFVVAPGDDRALRERLAALAADGELRARLGSRAAEVAATTFTARAMADRYLALYRGCAR